MLKLLLGLLLTGSSFAQNSITVTASRPTNATADQIVFSVDVLTPQDIGRDDVFSAVQGSIVTPETFAGVRTSYLTSAKTQLDWTFLVTGPLGNFKTTVTQLQALQQLVSQKKNGMSVSFSVYGTRASQEAQQTTACSASDLMFDARSQAQKIAVAAGAGLGNVLGMSGGTVTQAGSATLFSVPSSVPSCTLTVKFALTGF
jgi:hypothetical protein